MKWLFRCGAAAVLFVAVLAGSSINFRYGDLRFAVANRTMRHWDLVEAVKPACAAGFVLSGGYPCATATTYTLTGPTSGTIGYATSSFTVRPSGGSTATITPTDASHSGVFTPSTVTFDGSTDAQTFTYTPFQSGSNPGGTWNISTTNSGSLTNPSPISFTVSNILNGYPSFTGTGNSGWQDNATTHTTGGTTDPFGGTGAALLTENTASNQHYVFQHITIAASSSHTGAVIVAQNTGSRNAGVLLIDSGFANWIGLIVNPSTCAVVANQSGGAGTVTSTKATALSGGYCLIEFQGSIGTYSGDAQLFVELVNGTTVNYTGDGTSSLKIYGPVLQ